MIPTEVLEMFKGAGVFSVQRCSRNVDDFRLPTESVLVTFTGHTRPKKLYA